MLQSHLCFITAPPRYAVGGDGEDWLSSVEAYQPATDSWVAVASMRAPRGAPGVAVLGGLLYAVGGCVSRWCYIWLIPPHTILYTFTFSLHDRSCTLHSSTHTMIARYGSGESGHPSALWLTSAEAYSPTRDTWTAIAPLTGGKYFK